MKKKQKHNSTTPNLPRNKRVSFMLNEEEYKTINNYLAKYKIHNRSYWMRKTLLTQVIKVLAEHDYPTLFSEHEMRR